MTLPPWADSQFSQDLSQLRARGEGQDLEFKREFPAQVSDIGKEIAAFATSNTGTILFGVDDNGDLVGLGDMLESGARDHLLRRLEGISSGSVRPAVTPRAIWAMEDDCVVLVVIVPKGPEPIYYSGHRPYIRHITTSRPAEPHEVVELVRRHLSNWLEPDDSGDERSSTLLSELASILIRTLIWAETPERQRHLNPWLEEWRADCSQLATELRDLAATDFAQEEGLSEHAEQLAEHLIDVSTVPLTIGCGTKLVELAAAVKAKAEEVKHLYIDPLPLSNSSVDRARSLLRESARKLRALAERASGVLKTGLVDEAQSEAAGIGYQLAQLSFHRICPEDSEFSKDLLSLGMDLRLVEVVRIVLDGGRSLQRIVDMITECSNRMDALLERT